MIKKWALVLSWHDCFGVLIDCCVTFWFNYMSQYLLFKMSFVIIQTSVCLFENFFFSSIFYFVDVFSFHFFKGSKVKLSRSWNPAKVFDDLGAKAGIYLIWLLVVRTEREARGRGRNTIKAKRNKSDKKADKFRRWSWNKEMKERRRMRISNGKK